MREKEITRQEVEKAIAEYLARGKKIKVLPTMKYQAYYEIPVGKYESIKEEDL
jgi:hypothetical protein